MAQRDTPPFRADHVGSLLRPLPLLIARAQHAAGELGAQQLREVEDDAIREAVAMQRNVGLQSATDGEFRRASWHMDFVYRLDGVTRSDEDALTVRFRNPQGTLEFTPAAVHVDGRIGLPVTIFGDDFDFLASVTDATPKLSIPSPSMLPFRAGPAAIDRSVYPDLDRFWADLSAAYAAEIRGLFERGCRYLQLDDTSLAYLNDPAQREMVAARGQDPDTLHLRHISAINEALAGRPAGMTVTTHMCRGNFRSSWVAEGGYEHVAEAVFTGLDVDGFFLEYDDERSGGFEPLRFVPRDKLVVLGLVTTKRGELEDSDGLKRRIEQAARYVDGDQLCLSPQCGFSSTVEGNDLTPDEQAKKLALVVETAAEVWG